MDISRRGFFSRIAAVLPMIYFMTRGLGASTYASASQPAKSTGASSGSGGSELSPGARPRVVTVHSPGATGWDYSTYPYVDFVEQARVDAMCASAVTSLTGRADSKDAWREIFASYKPGDRVAIKPNFNDLHKGFGGLVTTPAVLNAVISALVRHVGVSPYDIFIYDCCRTIPDELRARVTEQVTFVEPYGSSLTRKIQHKVFGAPLTEPSTGHEIPMTEKVTDKEGRPVRCYLPNVIATAEHIINIPILKSHQYVSNSGALKNHYGTVRFSDGHGNPEYLHPPIIHNSIVDINNAALIRERTRLVITDALFGRIRKKGGGPERWSTFSDKSPEMIIASTDPVAMDSVCRYYLEREMNKRGEQMNPHDYLHIAEERGLGVHEDPDSKGRFRRIDLSELTFG